MSGTCHSLENSGSSIHLHGGTALPSRTISQHGAISSIPFLHFVFLQSDRSELSNEEAIETSKEPIPVVFKSFPLYKALFHAESEAYSSG